MLKRLLLILFFTLTLHATVPTQENVTKLYVATFNRAPDSAGLNYWVSSSGLKLEDIATSFFDQPEAKEKYPDGSTNGTFIDAIYGNLFNRQSDQAGFNYWKDELDAGRIAKSVFILAVVNGAQNDDANILTNKTDVGLSFAEAGETDTTKAKDIMASVTGDTTTVTAALKSYSVLLSSNATFYTFRIKDDHGDDLGTATIVSEDSTTAGNIETAGDIDVFKLVLKSNESITIKTSGQTDTLGGYFDSAGVLIFSDDNSGDNYNFTITQTLTAGTYYIAVKHANTTRTGAYSLVVSSSSTSEDDHGNDMDTATTIRVNSTTAGDIETAEDGDIFKLVVTSTEDYTIKTTGQTDTLGGLYDNTGSIISSNSGSNGNTNFTITQKLTAGTYYIQIKHAITTGTGTYSLVVSSKAIVSTTEDDHGDDIHTATIVSENSTTVGRIEKTEDDVDFFKLVVTNPGRYTINPDGKSATGTGIVLSDSTGDTITSGGKEVYIYRELSVATYYIKVYNFRYGGNYSLVVSSVNSSSSSTDLDPTTTSNPTPTADKSDYINDVMISNGDATDSLFGDAKATKITLKTSEAYYNGTLNYHAKATVKGYADDHDYYTFDIPSNATFVAVEIQGKWDSDTRSIVYGTTKLNIANSDGSINAGTEKRYNFYGSKGYFRVSPLDENTPSFYEIEVSAAIPARDTEAFDPTQKVSIGNSTTTTTPDTPTPSTSKTTTTTSTGSDAVQCIQTKSEQDSSNASVTKYTLVNNCSYDLAYFYCGDLRWSSKSCGGDAPKKQYFTHANSLSPGEESSAIHIDGPNFYYGACKGIFGLFGGNDAAFTDSSNGSYICNDPD